MSLDEHIREKLESVARRHPALDLLIIYGSRARGEAHAASDWDFAYLGRGVDGDRLRADLMAVVASDDIDVVDLRRCSALLAFHAARDGITLYQSQPDAFPDFQIHATLNWLDMEPVVRAAHREVLARLGP